MASFGIPDLDPSLEADLALGMQGVEELLREHIKGEYPLVEETSRSRSWRQKVTPTSNANRFAFRR